MNESLEEYEKRLVPASDEEIIELAERLWADPTLKPAFQRVGYHGDFTEAEANAMNSAIADYRQGDLWDRDNLHLALAPCLVRQRAANMIDRFDMPEVRNFLADRRMNRVGAMFKPAPTTLQEIVDFAKALRNDPAAWAMLQKVAEHREAFVHEVDKEGVVGRFETNYKFKYGLLNRGGLSIAIGHLRGVACGLFTSIDSPEAIASIQNNLALHRRSVSSTKTSDPASAPPAAKQVETLAPTEEKEILEAWPRRGAALFIWITFSFGVLLLSGFYVFDTEDLGDFLLWTLKLAPLLIPFGFFFVTSSVLLFTWKPIVRVGEDRIDFAFIGFSIHKDEVRAAVAQHNGLTENWRIAVELRAPKPRRFRTFLFYPAAFAFRNKVYILPMYLAEPRQETREAIVRALSLDHDARQALSGNS